MARKQIIQQRLLLFDQLLPCCFLLLCTDGPDVFRTAFAASSVVVAQEPLGLKDTVSKKERKNLRNGQGNSKIARDSQKSL